MPPSIKMGDTWWFGSNLWGLHWVWRCRLVVISPVQFSSITQSSPALCNPMDCSMPDFPVHHQLPELAQTHVHQVSDAIQPFYPLWSPSPPLKSIDSLYGKDWKQEEKGTTEDKMVGWHHWLDRHEIEQAPRVSDGQGSLAFCSPWSCIESDTTQWLSWLIGSPKN